MVSPYRDIGERQRRVVKSQDMTSFDPAGSFQGLTLSDRLHRTERRQRSDGGRRRRAGFAGASSAADLFEQKETTITCFDQG